MKKIFLVILFCLTFGIGYSQSLEYTSVNVGGAFCGYYCPQEESASGAISGSILIYQYLCTDLNMRISFNLNAFTFPEFSPSFIWGLGVEYAIIGDFYCFAETFPTFDIKGIGSKVYGNYLAFYLPLDLGIGYLFNITDKHCIYTELFFEKEFTPICEHEDMRRDGYGCGITIGYSYKIFSDIR